MKLVVVEWEDPSSTSNPTWQHREDIDILDAMPCTTVGILLKENDNDVRVVLSLHPDCFSQAIAIPKACIKRMRVLKLKGNP